MSNSLRLNQMRCPNWGLVPLILALGGCASMKATPPVTRAAPFPDSSRSTVRVAGTPAPAKRVKVTDVRPASVSAARSGDVQLAGAEEPSRGGADALLGAEEQESAGAVAEPGTDMEDTAAKSGRRLAERLKIPDELPGADAPPISLPPGDEEHPEARLKAIDDLFPEVPKITSDVQLAGTAEQKLLTLAELEDQALAANPLIAQAEGDVQAAYGAAIQAGLHPNPTVGYEADTVGSAGTRNYQGIFFTQTIKTAGKLDLARAAANIDLMNAQLALRKTRIELLKRVRAGYFAVLVARENLRIAEAIVKFTNEVYRVQVEQLKGGQPAAYEPMQLRTLSTTSRSAFQQARNRYISMWKQLAATTGSPDMPPTELDGRGDAPASPIAYDAALEFMLGRHTDMLAARNLEYQGQLHVRLAEVTPIPDINVYSAVQRDFTVPTIDRTTYNLQLGVPLPIFDRNQGNIVKSRGELVRASRQLYRVRLDLTALLADAFERYENNRLQMEYYRNRILPDMARVYRGVYERHQQESDVVGFTDVVFAQQNLLNAITTYIAAMTDRWTAYADIAGLLQVDILDEIPVAPEPAPAAPAPAAEDRRDAGPADKP